MFREYANTITDFSFGIIIKSDPWMYSDLAGKFVYACKLIK